MIFNFLTVFWRNLRRNALYSFINITGLAIGIACSLLILLWVQDELTFDHFVPKMKQLNQVWVQGDYDNQINSWRSVPLPCYEALKDKHSNITNTCVMDWGSDHLLATEEKKIIRQGYFASEEFLSMFEYEVLIGNPTEALDGPNKIVITQSLAKSLFGNEDPMGKIIRVDDQSPLTVSALIKDLPKNSSFEFEYLLPWKLREAVNPWVVENKTNWGNYSFQVFTELNDGQQLASTELAIENLLTENGEDEFPKKLILYPMERWRLYSSFDNGKEKGGLSDYVSLFTAIAAFILIIACINFMNLATARSEHRVKEVGIRKSLGSSRNLLISHFLGESMLIALIAYLFALLLAIIFMHPYNLLVDKSLSIDLTSPFFWIFSLSVITISGVISGIYPALYLSSFDPVKTLKGTVFNGKKTGVPRKILVTLQFTFAIILLIGTVVIFNQIRLLQNRDIGYDQKNLITISITDALEEHYDALKNELLQSGAVSAVTKSNSPIHEIHSNNFLGWPGKPESQRVIFTTIATEYDYTKTMGIDLLMGRDFSKEFSTDTGSIIVNKAALDLMKLDDPIGTNLDLWGSKKKLIGVVDNVLMGSPYEEVKPLFMIYNPGWISYITIRLQSNKSVQESLASVETIFNKYNPAYPFEFQFIDQEFDKKFTTIKMTQRLATIFTMLTIFITGLGLFGLASFTAEQRTKEIGIRKVLGASVPSLIYLIAKEFSRLVVIAFVIGAPAAWWMLDSYLNRYTIRTAIDWWVFPAAGLIALIFALAIVANQAHAAAQMNPTKSLRSE